MLIEDPLRKGAEEAERGFHVITGGRGGCINSGLIFTSLWGWGKQLDTNPSNCLVNKDIAPLTEPS